MPNLSNAKKALRQNKARMKRNEAKRVHIKNLTKKLKSAVAKKEVKDIEVLLQEFFKTVDKAAKKNVIHKNAAARKKARMVKMTKVTKK